MAGRRIFVNYRRDDSASHALNVAQYLEATFGKSNVFLDIDRMRAGQSFPTVLKERLQASKVMLAVIGPQWLSLQNDLGQRRIEDPGDWVRLEIATALQSGLVVIPVLVGGASLPRKADLPADLQPLTDQHAVTVTTNGFRNEMAGLVRDIRAVPGLKPWWLVGGGVAAASALMLGGWALAYSQGVPVWVPWSAARVDGSAGAARQVAAAEAQKAADKAAADMAQAEREAKLIADAEKRIRDELEAKQRADAETKRRADEAAAARKKADDDARAGAAAEAKRKAEEEARARAAQKTEEERKRAEGEARAKQFADAAERTRREQEAQEAQEAQDRTAREEASRKIEPVATRAQVSAPRPPQTKSATVESFSK